ncbi:hypothetical protein CL657_01125 [bacterium]|nr:hypothetical protein [bacterium]
MPINLKETIKIITIMNITNNNRHNNAILWETNSFMINSILDKINMDSIILNSFRLLYVSSYIVQMTSHGVKGN